MNNTLSLCRGFGVALTSKNNPAELSFVALYIDRPSNQPNLVRAGDIALIGQGSSEINRNGYTLWPVYAYLYNLCS